jgi:hypothetical protein
MSTNKEKRQGSILYASLWRINLKVTMYAVKGTKWWPERDSIFLKLVQMS